MFYLDNTDTKSGVTLFIYVYNYLKYYCYAILNIKQMLELKLLHSIRIGSVWQSH